MTYFFKKYNKVLTIFLITFAGYLSAQLDFDDSDAPWVDDNNDSMDMFSNETDYSETPPWGIPDVPYAWPRNNNPNYCCCNIPWKPLLYWVDYWSLNIDALFWTANQSVSIGTIRNHHDNNNVSNSNSAISSSNMSNCSSNISSSRQTSSVLSEDSVSNLSSEASSSTAPQKTERKSKNFNFQWTTGVRVGLGYTCPCWDIFAYGTYFSPSGKLHHIEELSEEESFLPAWGDSHPHHEINSDGHLRLKLTIGDLEFGHRFFFASRFAIRPFIGLRTIWLQQKLSMRHFKHSHHLQHAALKSTYNATGVRGGMDMEFGLGCGVRLYGTGAVSVVYGNSKFEAENKACHHRLHHLKFNRHDHFHVFRAITDGSVGLRWTNYFCDDWIGMTLQLGWEHHLFINQNVFENLIILNKPKNLKRHSGDLTVQGVTFSCIFEF